MRNEEFWQPLSSPENLSRVTRRTLVLAIPDDLKKLGGRCVEIVILKIDGWRVKYVFKSDRGVYYEGIGSYMYELSDHPRFDSGISFERYPTAKKCLEGADVEVSIKDGGPAELRCMLRGDFFRISAFVAGEPGEPYCTIPRDHLKLFNKFLGTLINNSRIKFCKKDGPCEPGVMQRPHNNFLFSVDMEHYPIDI